MIVLVIGMLIGAFIQYCHDLKPAHDCINGVVHERLDSTKDVYIPLSTACIKIK
jgi:hypothetical protein